MQVREPVQPRQLCGDPLELVRVRASVRRTHNQVLFGFTRLAIEADAPGAVLDSIARDGVSTATTSVIVTKDKDASGDHDDECPEDDEDETDAPRRSD